MATGKHRAREVSRRWRTVSLLLIGVLVGMLMISPAGAHFRRNTKHLGLHAWNQVIKGKVYTRSQANNRYYTKTQANNRFSQRLWALVGSSGDLLRGNRVVDTERMFTGSYRVVFDRRINNCGYQATLTSGVEMGFITISLTDQTNVALVEIRATDGATLANRSFSLLVTC